MPTSRSRLGRAALTGRRSGSGGLVLLLIALAISAAVAYTSSAQASVSGPGSTAADSAGTTTPTAVCTECEVIHQAARTAAAERMPTPGSSPPRNATVTPLSTDASAGQTRGTAILAAVFLLLTALVVGSYLRRSPRDR